MLEECRDNLKNREDKLDENTTIIIDLEEKEMKMESYKIFLYPKFILTYISNLMNLQAKENQHDQFYPEDNSDISILFNEDKLNPEISNELLENS